MNTIEYSKFGYSELHYLREIKLLLERLKQYQENEIMDYKDIMFDKHYYVGWTDEIRLQVLKNMEFSLNDTKDRLAEITTQIEELEAQ